MNKNHRVVWSAHRQAFVVAHEAASSRAPGPSSSAVAKAVAALALSAASHQVLATPACTAPVNGVITIDTATSFSCSLHGGTSIVVTADGSLEDIHLGGAALGGSIQNGGTVFGSYGPGIFIEISSLESITNTGTITATASGSDAAGILVSSASIQAGITNTGTIDVTGTSGTAHGIYLVDSQITGGITNTGTIQSTADFGNFASGLNLSQTTVTGGISNAGPLIGGDGSSGTEVGLGMFDSQAAFINNSGTIQATATSMGGGIVVGGSSLTTGITNSGTVIGGSSGTDSGYGIAIEDSTVGGIVNSGTIIGTGGIMGYGIALNGSTITGSISNSGTISGAAIGLQVANSRVNGSISNYAGGVIEALGVGLIVDEHASVGGIVNVGIIRGGEGSLGLDNTVSGFIVHNTGTLDGGVSLGINTLNLNGDTSRVIGTTRGSGTVNVNGTFTSEGRFRVGNFNVASTGVFHQEHGVSVSEGIVSNHGVWDVGTGSQTITGDFEQSSGGTLRLGLSSASTYGSLQVRGEATVADGSSVFVNVIGAPTLVIDSTITGVLTAENGLTANASTLSVRDNSALYKFSAATTSDPGHALDLIVEKDSVGLPAAVRSAGYVSAEGAAQALQSMFNDGIPAGMQDIFDRLNNMTDEEAAAAVSQTLPSITGASAQAAVSALRSMNKVIQSRIESLQGLSSGDGGADRYAWVRAFGNWSDQNNRRGVAGFKSDTGGLVIGADAPLSDKLRAGGAFTYAKSSIKSKSTAAASKVDVDTFEVVGYASYNIDPHTDINYQLDVGTNKASSSREVSFMGTRAKADFDSVVVHGSVGIGRLMPISPATSWTPSVRVDYTHMRTEGYTEDGAGALNLDVDAQTYRELLLTGDAKVSHQFEGGLKLLANASLGYDFINKQAKSTSTFTGGGPAFVTDGLDVSPWFYRLGAGLVKETGKGVEYSVRYDMEGRTSGYLNQSVSAKVRWAF